MKNFRLAVKIALGFGLVLLLACALGVMAIIQMDTAGDNAERMQKEYVPEVGVASKLERHALLAMYNMRGYALSTNPELLAEGMKQIAEMNKYLGEARALSEKHPGLVKLRDALGNLSAKASEYEKLSSETKTRIDQNAKDSATRLRIGGELLKLSELYMNNQETAFRSEVDKNATHETIFERYDKIETMNHALAGISAMRIDVLYGYTRNDISYYQSAKNRFPVVETAFTDLKSNAKNKANIEALDAMILALREYRNSLDTQIQNTKSLQEINVSRNNAAQELLKACEQIADAGLSQTARLADESNANLDRSVMIMAVGLACAVGVGILIGLFITRAITGPVRKGVDFAKVVAGGDYSKTLDIDQKDEIGELAKSLNAMVGSLKEKIAEANEKSEEAAKQADKANVAMNEADESRKNTDQAMARMLRVASELQQVAEVLTSASEQLSAQVEQSSRGAENQAQRVAETATAMEEMNATVLEVAKNASEAADTSDKAKTTAEEGSNMVGQVVKAISEVETQAQSLKRDMGTLGAQAEGIGRIMNVISDIADQTNLLALNAAIEAARAGEAGRGFAVVADEVRKLAEKTMSATKEVGDAISGIQQGTRTNIDNVEKAVHSIEDATRLATNSGESLAAIVSLVGSASDQVRSIAAASEEQSAASEEINRSIEDVSTISGETSQAMNEASQAVNQLAQQAMVLKGLVEDMQNGQGESRPALS